MTRSLFAVLAFFFALVLAPSALAYTPPPMTAHVTDPAHVLTEPERLAIDAKLEAYNQATTNEIVVFLPASLEGEESEAVAFAALRTWGIGKKGKDNGVVLMIAPAERKAYIAVGKGAEGDLPDLKAMDIIQHQIKPNLAPGRENYRAAVDAATTAIMAALGTSASATPARRKAASGGDALFGLLLLIFIVVVPILLFIALIRFITGAFSSNGRGAYRGWTSGSSWANDSSWSSGGGSSWSDGGGGGDSGFTGGGGDSGGGGAGDSF
jgi:uncharacterized protein